MSLRYLTSVFILIAAMSCGGGGGGSTPTTPAPPSFPNVAGAWTGMLIGATPETSAALRLTIEQTDVLPGGLQRIHGLWTATAGSRQMSGNFNGGLETDGRMQFTLDAGSADCNFSMNVRVAGSRIEGTFGTVGPIGCRPTPVSTSGRVELTRQ